MGWEQRQSRKALQKSFARLGERIKDLTQEIKELRGMKIVENQELQLSFNGHKRIEAALEEWLEYAEADMENWLEKEREMKKTVSAPVLGPIKMQAGEAIRAGQLVCVGEDGLLYLASPTNDELSVTLRKKGGKNQNEQ